jgi:hypothetical protein
LLPQVSISFAWINWPASDPYRGADPAGAVEGADEDEEDGARRASEDADDDPDFGEMTEESGVMIFVFRTAHVLTSICLKRRDTYVYYKLAADQNCAEAQFLLGMSLQSGSGLEADLTMAAVFSCGVVFRLISSTI